MDLNVYHIYVEVLKYGNKVKKKNLANKLFSKLTGEYEFIISKTNKTPYYKMFVLRGKTNE